eukprot:6419070-Ditylum_brightwellii.AAC.1
MRFDHKKTGKLPRPMTGGPVRGWWTPYIFMYNRLTNLIKMMEDIQMGLKGIFGQKSSHEKQSRKNKYEWHYRLNIIGWPRPRELCQQPKHEMVLSSYMLSSQHSGYLKKR